MIKSFAHFINEETDQTDKFLKDLAIKLIHKIRTTKLPESEDYVELAGMQFTEPIAFDLILLLRKDSSADIKTDSHFKGLPWEELNYSEYGYSIDANTYLNRRSGYPKIVINLIVDSTREPELYSRLFARVLDILTHETTHVEQSGVDREPFNQLPSNPNSRELAKKSYKYFLLDDEVESMVTGMYASAKQQKKPLDVVFDEYLQPFIKSKYITPTEYLKVMQKWVTFAAQFYPDVKFSSKVDQIINSL